MNKSSQIKGLVISAGLSSRMPGLKPLLDYEGKPFLGGILLKLSLICDTIVVVTGFESQKIKVETQSFLGQQVHNINSRVNWCFNQAYEKGMFSSLQKGVEEINGAEWILYHFVDQPGLPIDFYTQFHLEMDNNFDWIQPTYLTKKGHPILFSAKVTELIRKSDITNSLSALKSKEKIKSKYWDCNFPQVLQDIDVNEDFIDATKT